MPSQCLVDDKGLLVPDCMGDMADGGQAIKNDFQSLVDWRPKSVWNANRDPTKDDDVKQEFFPGSMGLTLNQQGVNDEPLQPPRLFGCKDSAAGAAQWQLILFHVIQDVGPSTVDNHPQPKLGGDLRGFGEGFGLGFGDIESAGIKPAWSSG